MSDRILLSQDSLICQGPERQQEISTAHATFEQTVLKSRTKPCVRKSNQCFCSGQRSTSTICNSLKQTQIKTSFSPLFSVSQKRSVLVTSFSESQENSQQYSIQPYISTVSHSNPSCPPLIWVSLPCRNLV